MRWPYCITSSSLPLPKSLSLESARRLLVCCIGRIVQNKHRGRRDANNKTKGTANKTRSSSPVFHGPGHSSKSPMADRCILPFNNCGRTPLVCQLARHLSSIVEIGTCLLTDGRSLSVGGWRMSCSVLPQPSSTFCAFSFCLSESITCTVTRVCSEMLSPG